ncbi:MAG: extracellular solute-binding protein [Lachnospiraceae bacterium]|nr:extracellular solute-binding protein [Lachnospiraceae bacterium]
MKKVVSIILALVLGLTCLVGCGNSNTGAGESTGANSNANVGSEGGNATTGDVEKVIILYPGEETDAMANFINNQLNPRLEKEVGISLEFIYKGWDQYWEQKDVMLGTEVAIDLYWDGLPDLATMVNKSHCQPLDELIATYCPDMLKVFPESQLAGGVVNGVQYGIPSAYAPSSCMFQLVCVRQDILEAVGMTEIKTAEDLRKFAELAKDKYPELNGPADIIFKPLTRYFADEHYTWCAYDNLVVYGEDTKKAVCYFETDAFKDVAKYNASMYEAGLYQDELTTNYNERDSRMQ